MSDNTTIAVGEVFDRTAQFEQDQSSIDALLGRLQDKGLSRLAVRSARIAEFPDGSSTGHGSIPLSLQSRFSEGETVKVEISLEAGSSYPVVTRKLEI